MLQGTVLEIMDYYYFSLPTNNLPLHFHTKDCQWGVLYSHQQKSAVTFLWLQHMNILICDNFYMLQPIYIILIPTSPSLPSFCTPSSQIQNPVCMYVLQLKQRGRVGALLLVTVHACTWVRKGLCIV